MSAATVRYLSTAELVARLGVTRQTLARWCDEGMFCTPYYFGRAKRFLLADVEGWEAAHRQAPPSAEPTPESRADAGGSAP